MSITAMDWAWEQRCHSSAAKAVLVCLSWYANKEGERAFPSVMTISVRTQLDDRTVRKALKGLVAAGLITPNARLIGSRQLSTEYRLNIRDTPPPNMGPPNGKYLQTGEGEGIYVPLPKMPPPTSEPLPKTSPDTHDPPPNLSTPLPKVGAEPRKELSKRRKKGIAKAIPAAAPPGNVIPIRQPEVAKAQPSAKPKTMRQRFMEAMVPRVQAATGWSVQRCYQILGRALNDAHGSFITVVQAIERLEEDGEYQRDMVRFFFATLAAKLRAPLPYDENDQVGL